MARHSKTSSVSQRAEAILHPVRLRIVKVLERGRMTPFQIGEQLPGVSQASLYRHINKLLDAGVVEIVERHQTHGTVERVFALVKEQSVLAYNDLALASGEDLAHFARLFFAELTSTFERYFLAGQHDLSRDSVVLLEQVVHVTPDEAAEIRLEFRNLMQRYLSNPAGEGRFPRSVAVLSVPEVADVPLPPNETKRLKDESHD